MILPIIAYGDPVLRKKAVDFEEDYPDLKKLVANMFETMYNASGVGLAGPQIGLAKRIFLVDTHQVLSNVEEGEENDFEGEEGIKKAFINAQIIEESGKSWVYNEGCLSIPDIREDVTRLAKIRIQYYDADFNFYEEEYEGLTARVILHEYDHIEGVLFTEHLSMLRRRLLKKKLEKITKGEVQTDYRMKFPRAKRKRK